MTHVRPALCALSFAAACILLGSAAPASGDSPQQLPPLPSGWKRVNDSAFTIDMPAPVARTESQVKGESFPMYTAGADDGTLYQAGALPRAAAGYNDDDKALTSAGLGIIDTETCHGKLKDAKIATHALGKTLHFTAKCADGKSGRTGLIYLVKGRFYLLVITIKGPPDAAAARRFFGSFNLVSQAPR